MQAERGFPQEAHFKKYYSGHSDIPSAETQLEVIEGVSGLPVLALFVAHSLRR
jgi:hypothetical protein